MIPTVSVTCESFDQNGNPIAGARFEAKLDRTEIYDGFVVPEKVTAIADTNGVCVLELWPNALGANASSYAIKAWNPDTGKRFIDTTAVVPNSDCRLEQIIVAEPYPALDAAQQALLAAQGALAPVSAQAQAAAASALVAQDAEDGALAAETAAQASAAAAQASQQAAATSQASASSSASAAAGAAQTASTAADAAETASDAAQAAATSATAQATAAGQSAQAADASADAAAASQASASGSASSAQSHATAAAGSANTAQSNAAAALQAKADAQAASSTAQAAAQQAGDAADTATGQAALAASAVPTALGHAAAAAAHASTATAKASEASASASTASAKADEAAASAASTLAIYGSTAAVQSAVAQATGAAASATSSAVTAAFSATQAAASAENAISLFGSLTDVQEAADDAQTSALAAEASATTAQAQASLAAGYAASAASVVQQDLSGVNAAALHRSPNAITALFVYDTSKDSDGGAWTEKCQGTSWYNESLSGKWLGAQPSELYARNEGATLGSELVTNGDFSNGTTGWSATGSASLSVVSGKLRVANGAATTGGATQTINTVAGRTYRWTYSIDPVTSGGAIVRVRDGSTSTVIATETHTTSATRSIVFVAQGATTQINGINAGTTVGVYHELDNISIREVTSQTTQTGDYFQLTTDGRFYRLNEGSGTTQTFRGNKADFPRLAAIVAESAYVTIYDLTEPGRPMWMRFANAYNASINRAGQWLFIDSASYQNVVNGIAAVNGELALSSSAVGPTDAGGLFYISFTKDALWKRNNAGNHYQLRNIAQRSTNTLGHRSDLSGAIPSYVANAVAMTVLPDAPVDPVTGLKVPTIAVATAGGVSVIKHNGTVVNSSNVGAFITLTLTPALLSAAASSTNWYYATKPGELGASFALNLNSGGQAPDFKNGNNIQGGITAPSRSDFLRRTLSGALVQKLKNFEANPARSPAATITNTYNTGHMTGDIRRTYLADNVVESVTGTELIGNGGPGFLDTTGWTTINASVSVVDGKLRVAGTANFCVGIYAISTVVGKSYSVVAACTYVSGTDGSVFLEKSDSAGGNVNTATSAKANARPILLSFTATATTSYIKLYSTNLATLDWSFVSVKEASIDRSYKAKGANITGTLTKTEVASAAQLVAYSGFSAANYLREPYSADLDFGTSEWSVGAWVNVPKQVVTVADSGGLNYAPAAYADYFPKVADVVTGDNSTFDSDTGFWVKGTGWVISGGVATHTGTVQSNLTNNSALTIGKAYLVSLTVSGGLVNVFAGGSSYRYNLTGNASVVLVATGGQIFIQSSQDGVTVDNLTYTELGAASVVDRAFSSGAAIKLGMNPSGTITATTFDGTTTRTVTTSAAYNTATWIKAEADYTTDGTLAISVNGVEVATTRGNPLLTLNNSNAVLTIGNSYVLDAPFPGSIALLKFSATVPTAEQSVWMYEQEKQLFRAGAQCCLPDSGSIVDLTYDEATDKWIAVSAANESEWAGLVRTSVTPVPAGSYTRAAAASGVQLLARSTTSPGVDITIPAYGLREELVKRAEAAARLNTQLATLDYVGGFTANTTNGSTAITSVAGLTYPVSYVGARVSGSGIPANTTIVAVSGTTIYLSAAATATATGVQISFVDFILPVGMEAKEVSLAGAAQREGSTAQYTRLFDGFKETIRFGTAPSHTALVQIQAARSAA